MIDTQVIDHCQTLIKSARTLERSFSQPLCVLDTNIALDLWHFDDPSCRPIKSLIENEEIIPVGHFDTLVELADVLSRPHFQLSEEGCQLVLERWLHHTAIFEGVLREDSYCRDSDDDKFSRWLKQPKRAFFFQKIRKFLKRELKRSVSVAKSSPPSNSKALSKRFLIFLTTTP